MDILEEDPRIEFGDSRIMGIECDLVDLTLPIGESGIYGNGAGKISSVAFDPTFVLDKSNPALKKKWPRGFLGFFWKVMAILLARPPAIAGEPIANLMLSHRDRSAINGAMFQLDKRIEKPDKAMNDEVSGKRLWDELVLLTGLTAK